MKISLAGPLAVEYSSPPPDGPYAHVPFADRWPAQRLRLVDRAVLAAAGCVLVAMLALAWRLTPDARGMGTHQQLGLAPCTVVQWFGLRCPSCGMTTAWAHFARGRVLEALRANAGGAVLAACALFMGPWLLGSAAAGRWVVTPPRDTWLFMAAMLVVVVTLTQWALRVSLGW